MFFQNRIVSIKENHKVLEIGPGATPHPRADIFLELEYENQKDRIRQSGNVGILKTTKPVVYYNGSDFPFEDNEFDYAICSHVLEHVSSPPDFLAEVFRVAGRGYIEFPTIYYDFLYDFHEHVNLLYWSPEGCLNWMKKDRLPFGEFSPITGMFKKGLDIGCHGIIKEMMNVFFQGFEYSGSIKLQRVDSIEALVFKNDVVLNPHCYDLGKSYDKKKLTFFERLRRAYGIIIRGN